MPIKTAGLIPIPINSDQSRSCLLMPWSGIDRHWKVFWINAWILIGIGLWSRESWSRYIQISVPFDKDWSYPKNHKKKKMYTEGKWEQTKKSMEFLTMFLIIPLHFWIITWLHGMKFLLVKEMGQRFWSTMLRAIRSCISVTLLFNVNIYAQWNNLSVSAVWYSLCLSCSVLIFVFVRKSYWPSIYSMNLCLVHIVFWL